MLNNFKIPRSFSWVKQNKIWFLAAIVIPFVTVGYDYLEITHLYDAITGTSRLNSAVGMLYSSDPGLQNGLFIESATSSREFASLAMLVYSNGDMTSDLVPTFILRMAIKNAPYVNMPPDLDELSRYMTGTSSKQLILGTDFSPAVLGSCPRRPLQSLHFPMCKVRNIGNKYELEQKIEERKRSFRIEFNITVTLLAVIFAFRERRSASISVT